MILMGRGYSRARRNYVSVRLTLWCQIVYQRDIPREILVIDGLGGSDQGNLLSLCEGGREASKSKR